MTNVSVEHYMEDVIKEAVVQRCSVKKMFLEVSQNSQENTCARVSFLIKLQTEACNFIKKETLTQVFSYEFCEISKNIFFRRTPLVAASVIRYQKTKQAKNGEKTIFERLYGAVFQFFMQKNYTRQNNTF